jgi:hypothetical protein
MDIFQFAEPVIISISGDTVLLTPLIHFQTTEFSALNSASP